MLVALFIGRMGDLYVLLSRCVFPQLILISADVALVVHLLCVPTPVTRHYQEAGGNVVIET